MVGSVTERLAPDSDFLIRNGTNVTAEVDTTARDAYRVQVAAATTVLGGLIQVWTQRLTNIITACIGMHWVTFLNPDTDNNFGAFG